MLKKKIALIIIPVALILILFSCMYFRHGTTKKYITLYGNVDVREVQLGFRVPGRIQEMPFEEGDLVKTGSFMSTLDKEPYIDQVNEAKASITLAKFQLANAEIILERREKLRGTGAISDENYTDALSSRDIALAQLNQAETVLATALTNLNDTQIFAPTEGTILTRIQEPGAIVNAADPIYTLSVLSPVWVRAYVSEPELGLIYPGMEATIITDTPGGKTYKGQIGFISPVAEFTPKTVQTSTLRTDLVYRIRVYASNPDHFLKQGMPVTVELKLEKPISDEGEETADPSDDQDDQEDEDDQDDQDDQDLLIIEVPVDSDEPLSNGDAP